MVFIFKIKLNLISYFEIFCYRCYCPIYCTFSACAGKLSSIPSRSLLGLGSVDVERKFTLAYMILQIIFNY